jgi:hypothetical protein
MTLLPALLGWNTVGWPALRPKGAGGGACCVVSPVYSSTRGFEIRSVGLKQNVRTVLPVGERSPAEASKGVSLALARVVMLFSWR